MLKKVLRLIKGVLFPPRCACCTQVLPRGEELCDSCAEELFRIPSPVCPRCGHARNRCVCRFSYSELHYDGCCAPFYYKGAARRGICQMKFGGRVDAADYFAGEMATALQKNQPSLVLDGVVWVPLRKSRRRERGYNQAEILARRLALLLHLPCMDVLEKTRDNRTQHELHFAERFSNVQNAYRCTSPVTGRKLLLIDDIKTTGATLDACAEALKKSGAAQVFCLTAAIVEPRAL